MILHAGFPWENKYAILKPDGEINYFDQKPDGLCQGYLGVYPRGILTAIFSEKISSDGMLDWKTSSVLQVGRLRFDLRDANTQMYFCDFWILRICRIIDREKSFSVRYFTSIRHILSDPMGADLEDGLKHAYELYRTQHSQNQ
jgi:hypothetical protein